MSFLLDANVLIALGWPAHEHHTITSQWFARNALRGWATTAFTQAAFVRIIAQPAVSGGGMDIGDIAEVLLRNVAHPAHRFVSLDFGFETVLGICTGGVVGRKAHLLTLG